MQEVPKDSEEMRMGKSLESQTGKEQRARAGREERPLK